MIQEHQSLLLCDLKMEVFSSRRQLGDDVLVLKRALRFDREMYAQAITIALV